MNKQQTVYMQLRDQQLSRSSLPNVSAYFLPLPQREVTRPLACLKYCIAYINSIWPLLPPAVAFLPRQKNMLQARPVLGVQNLDALDLVHVLHAYHKLSAISEA